MPYLEYDLAKSLLFLSVQAVPELVGNHEDMFNRTLSRIDQYFSDWNRRTSWSNRIHQNRDFNCSNQIISQNIRFESFLREETLGSDVEVMNPWRPLAKFSKTGFEILSVTDFQGYSLEQQINVAMVI